MAPPLATGTKQEPAVKNTATMAYTVLYDGQCEICQAGVSWLRILDRKHRTNCLPLSAEALSALNARLRMEDCLRQLHIVTPEGRVRVG